MQGIRFLLAAIALVPAAQAQPDEWRGVITITSCLKVPESGRAACVQQSLTRIRESVFLVVGDTDVYELSNVQDLPKHLGIVLIRGKLENRRIKISSISDVAEKKMAPATLSAPAPSAEQPGRNAGRISLNNGAPAIDAPATPDREPEKARDNHVVRDRQDDNIPRRLVALSFNDSSVKSSVESVLGTNQNVGAGIRELFVQRASQEKLTMVERSHISEFEPERYLSAAGNFNKMPRNFFGGVDAVLVGDIVAFGRDDKKSSSALKGLGGIGIRNSRSKAAVTIRYRLIDPVTTEVIAAGEVTGESESTAPSSLGPGSPGSKPVDLTSQDFAKSLIGEATNDAVNKLAGVVAADVRKINRPRVPIEGLVAAIDGRKVFLNIGTHEGVRPGDVLEVFRIIREVRDPATKEVLDVEQARLGELRVTEVRDRIAIGDYQGDNQGEDTRVGDLVRAKPATPQP